MSRKHISILFLFVANALLLAHSFVPHHHHHEQLCLTKEHCTSCDHVHLEASHEHSASEGDFCLVRSMYAVTADRANHQSIRTVQHIDRSLFLTARLLALLPEPESKTYTHSPDHPNLYSYLGTWSIGLRAPPVV